MKKTIKKSTIILLIVTIIFAIASISTLTYAYLTSKRKTVGYINFATGIVIDYKNVNDSMSSESYGNLKYVDDLNENMIIDAGELNNLELNSIDPSDRILIANPAFSPKQDTTAYALRSRIVITDLSNLEAPVEYKSDEEIKQFLSTIFQNGTIEFGTYWKQDSSNKNFWHYLVSSPETTNLKNDLKACSYNPSFSTQETTYLFNGETVNQNLISLTVVDGEPIEEIPASSIKIEVFVEAIQYSSVSVWFK